MFLQAIIFSDAVYSSFMRLFQICLNGIIVATCQLFYCTILSFYYG